MLFSSSNLMWKLMAAALQLCFFRVEELFCHHASWISGRERDGLKLSASHLKSHDLFWPFCCVEAMICILADLAHQKKTIRLSRLFGYLMWLECLRKPLRKEILNLPQGIAPACKWYTWSPNQPYPDNGTSIKHWDLVLGSTVLMPSVHSFMHADVLTINVWLEFWGLSLCFGLFSPCVTAGKGLEKLRTPQFCSGQKGTIWNQTLTPSSMSHISDPAPGHADPQ